MSIAKVLPTQFVKTVQIFTVIFALLLVYASVPTPAKAAGLTNAQIDAIISILTAFGADADVVANVQLDLYGQPHITTPSVGFPVVPANFSTSATPTCTLSASPSSLNFA